MNTHLTTVLDSAMDYPTHRERTRNFGAPRKRCGEFLWQRQFNGGGGGGQRQQGGVPGDGAVQP